MKIEKLPLASDAHVGLVTGIGTGLNIGFDLGFKLFNLKIGPEIEQVISDVDYSAGINSLRIGGNVSLKLTDSLNINFHLGYFNFQVKNSDIHYGSHTYTAGTKSYKGNYSALSIDYIWQDFLFSPKLIVNNVEDGAIFNELDFNIGREF